MTSFKSKTTFEQRVEESNRILQKYKDRIPVIVEPNHEKNGFVLDKNKYLVPSDLTIGQFLFVLRKRLKITQDVAIFIFIKEQIPPSFATLSQIYNESKDEDGFLYCTIARERTFGSSSGSYSG